jgi:hypothetical protein
MVFWFAGFGALSGTFPAIQYSNFRAYYYDEQQLKVFLRDDELLDLPASRNTPTLRLRRNRKRRAVGVHRLDGNLSKVVEAHEQRHAVESGQQPG